MSIMPWFRMYSEFATDPKVQMLSESDQRRYIMLLCLRCCNGSVTLHDDEIAFQLRISNEQWIETKATLVVKQLIDEDNTPVAWDKRQYVSDSSAKRVAAHRARKKAPVKQACNVTVTPPDTDTDTDTDIRARAKPAQKTLQVVANDSTPISIDDRQKAPIDLDWQPTQKILHAMSTKSGVTQGEITSDMITAFKLWHSGKQTHETNHGWHTNLVRWAIRERSMDAKSQAKQSQQPNFHDDDGSWANDLGY
jgi:Tfp pilus assembly major pilin PilA